MDNVIGKRDRAKALLTLLEKISRKLPESVKEEDRKAAAAAQLDEELGEVWREELEAGEESAPEASSSPQLEKRNHVNCMYKKIKQLLEENGEPSSSIDEGRMPLEEEETDDEEAAPKKVRILILG